jgi:hypothetical protein
LGFFGWTNLVGTSLHTGTTVTLVVERYAPFWGFETPLIRKVATGVATNLTHAVGEPVTYVQVLRTKGHRGRDERFSNSPITRDK